ncbi:glycoside hydrolase family 28 protein [Saccharicrinis aurantiacus]|uniref:glycoside hydrolase family 28 protein n=1 Tax=Saccharicrinis aurantiacus TaxID=1849719 RepID=UPI00248FFF9B|nr:glycosyl hydrolase family 28 protein [Saccharicrinis aurantiacus]
MKNLLYIVSMLLAVTLLSCQSDKHYVITTYGAISDQTTINTRAIQQAIDDCHNNGGGTVIVPSGHFITGTVLLKDNVTLHVEEGAQLIGSDNPMDYISIDPFTDATGQVRGKCLVGAEGANNIAITGQGIIDGRGELFLSKNIKKTMKRLGVDQSEYGVYASNRPFLVRLVKSSNIQVKDISLRQPAAWTLHFFQSKNILVDGVKIYSHAHKNNDGIDLDSSSDAIIQNCDIDSGDDAICFKTTSPVATSNVVVSNCTLKSDWGTIKFGTESMGDFKNIVVKNCTINDTRGGGIKILSVDGANIDNILIDNIKMNNVDMPIFIRLGERLRTYRDAPKQKVGSIKNIQISNVTAVTRSIEESRVTPPAGIFITGTPNHSVENITLSNIAITLPGGGTAEQVKAVIAEDEKRYPEFSFFGVLPAYGLYARHAKNIVKENITFSLEGEDAREEIIIEEN